MQKSYPIAQLKAVTPSLGIFEATVSVFGNVDLIGDRVQKGAFSKSLADWQRSGDPIPVIWSHDWDNPDAHIGKVLKAQEITEGLLIQGQLDLDNPFAAQVYRLLKERRVKEMSFAYDVVKERRAKDGANDLLELNLIEVGPTLKGMNPATQLITVKKAIAAHSTSTSDSSWDGPAQKANLPNEDGEKAYRAAFAWYDQNASDPNSDGYPDNKGAWKFIHHFVSADGEVGAASTVACSTGIGVLNGGRTGTTIPDADRAGVHAHLAKHLSDAGETPPELKSAEDFLEDQVEELFELKAGRTISKANETKIQNAITALQEVLDSIQADSVEKAGSPAGAGVEDELLRYRTEIDSMRVKRGA